MARSIVLGNGNIVVSLDAHAQVRDFYFPQVGWENHTNVSFPHKIGIWLDGEIGWLDGPGWDFSINYAKGTMASDIKAENKSMEVELRFLDVVYNEKNIFIRKVAIRNLSKRNRSLKVFFNQQFQIYADSRGNTAFYDPHRKAVVHYKGKRVFLVSGMSEGRWFDDYSIGLVGIEGMEGTWKDAEDGVLSGNAVEHGSVDSTIGFSSELGGEDTRFVTYWVTAGKYLDIVHELHDYVLSKKPEHLLETTQDFWRAWAKKPEIDFIDLDERLIDLFSKSLLIIRTHVDNEGGIIASGDGEILQYGRDNYSYVWPRDASFVAMALDKTGYTEITRRFFEFSNEVLSKDGYYYHKYLPDRSLGSSWHPLVKDKKIIMPIQEDETALVLYALFKHYESAKDIEFIEGIYNSLIKKSADFLCGFRDKKIGLPLPSYDLWEQSFGIATFTVAATVAGLEAGAFFARLLGKEEDEKKYSVASKEIKELIFEYFYDKESGSFYKLINIENGEIVRDKTVDMSSVFGIFKFGIVETSDERFKKAIKNVEETLLSKNELGGVVRYDGDGYCRAGKDSPSNPWFITTLWLAQYYISVAEKKSDMKKPLAWLNWTADRALHSGVLSEQISAVSGEQLSASPLAWSHAEYVLTVLEYLDKIKKLK